MKACETNQQMNFRDPNPKQQQVRLCHQPLYDIAKPKGPQVQDYRQKYSNIIFSANSTIIKETATQHVASAAIKKDVSLLTGWLVRKIRLK